MRLADALRNSAIDIVVATGGASLSTAGHCRFGANAFSSRCRKGHPLATSEAIYWTDLRKETILLSPYDPGRELEYLLLAKVVSAADRPKVERHDVSRGIIKTLITLGLGVSLVAESDIGVTFQANYREVRDGLGSSQVHYSAHWRKDNDNPALTTFLNLLSERYPCLAPADSYAVPSRRLDRLP